MVAIAKKGRKDLVEGGSDHEVHEVDERQHDRMLDAIISLDGKEHRKINQRTVPTNDISEFNFSNPGGKAKVSLHELVGSLKSTTSHGELKKHLGTIQKGKKTVSVPLPKHQTQQIERSLAYEKTKEDIGKWDPIVIKNRTAENLVFPLQKPEVQIYNADQFVKRFEARTPLEIEVAKLLHGSENNLTKETELTAAEENALKAMSLEEAKQRRADLQRHRVMMSYQLAKAKRLKKIKSKKYRRILKKDKLKNEKKALDELQKNDPEAYEEKLLLLEKSRIQERMSLKHRGGSKFAKKQMIYAKYDDKTRQSVQDMLQKSRELTQKLQPQSDDDDEEEADRDDGDMETMLDNEPSASKNPWMLARQIPESSSGLQKLQPIMNTEVFDEEEFETQENRAQDEDDEGEEVADIIEDIFSKKYTEKTSPRKIKKHKLQDTLRYQKKNELTSNIKVLEPEKSRDSEIRNTLEDVNQQLNTKEVSPEDNSKSTKKEVTVSPNNKETSPQNKRKSKKKKKKDKQNERQADEKANQKQQSVVNFSSENRKPSKRKVETALSKKQKKEKSVNESVDKDESSDDSDDEGHSFIRESKTRKMTLQDLEENWSDDDENISVRPAKVSKVEKKQKTSFKESVPEVHVDPHKLFTLETSLSKTKIPEMVESGDEDTSPDHEQRMTIAQAFADDDVIEEFKQEKAAIVDADAPKDIDLSLPGWGQWGGEGIKPKKTKNPALIIKAGPQKPRKDRMLGHVIISEKKDESIKKHQVNVLPHPYTSIEQFQQSIRQPIGNQWNPESAFKKLITPKIETPMGTIIEPIDNSALVEHDEKMKKKKQMRQEKTEKKQQKKFDKNNKKHKKHKSSK